MLVEEDGSTLRYALQGVHGQQLPLPMQRKALPSTELLDARWEKFLATA